MRCISLVAHLKTIAAERRRRSTENTSCAALTLVT
jgi:hypothetical protein